MSKVQESLEKWCKAEGIEFASPEAKAAYQARARRIADAILLKEPDRIPVTPLMEFFYARYGKVSAYDVLYDMNIAADVTKKTVFDLEPDAYEPPFHFMTGPLFDALDLKQLKWPGHGVPRENAFQFVEAEYMKADEYDAFLKDPSDYMLRTFLPRSCGNLSGLAGISPFRQMFAYYTMYTPLIALGTPDGVKAMQALMKAGEASLNYISFMNAVNSEIASQGYPSEFGAFALAPFDALSDTMRGTHGAVLDIYRQPDVLKEACEKCLWLVLDMAVATAKASGHPVVFIPLHKGTATTPDGKGGFMSIDQFKEFYWPTLQKLIVGLVDHGLVPNLFIEGDYTSRLDIIKDVPEASCVFHFEQIDRAKAKATLKDRVCIRGGIPIQLMWTGTPEKVKDYCKEVMDVFGAGGGFLLDISTASEDVKPENMRAMIETAKEYGMYR